MNLSDLKPPKGAKHAKKRVGRGYGSGNGVTSGRGDKGQKSRSGFKRKRGFEGGQMPLHRRLPKRGFFNPFRVEYTVVNLDTLAERFEAGAVVTPEVLCERGIVRSRRKPIKVLARGEIDRALNVKAHKFSGRAAEKIQAAGGSAEVVTRAAAEAESGSIETSAVEAAPEETVESPVVTDEAPVPDATAEGDQGEAGAGDDSEPPAGDA